MMTRPSGTKIPHRSCGWGGEGREGCEGGGRKEGRGVRGRGVGGCEGRCGEGRREE